MTTERLLALATEFALATGAAERAYAYAARATTDDERDEHTAKAQQHQVTATQRQEELRRALRTVTESTVRAVPDGRLAVSMWQRGLVEVRAITTNGARAVRVRYTPAEAIAAGTALIACAAITDTADGGGALSRILGTGAPAPATGQDTPGDGTRA
jgi:hypothetical protein